jgi:hypothetical protein
MKNLISRRFINDTMKHIYTIGILLMGMVTSYAQSTRTVLLETVESTWVASNAENICNKESVKSQFSDDELAVISFHTDDLINGGDPMFKTFADEWAQTYFVTSFDRGAIDRYSYNGTTMTSLSGAVWQDSIQARINRSTDGLVTIPELLYDESEEEIFVRVQLDITDSTFSVVNRELRFFVYLVQDAVQHPQVYDPATNLGSCLLFPGPIDTIDLNGNEAYAQNDFQHNDVAILNPSGYDGTDNIISQQTIVGNRFHSTYSFSKPSGTALGNLRVVAFVANYSNADVTLNELMNASQSNDFITYEKTDVTDPNHPDNPDNPNSQQNPDNWATSVEEIEGFDSKMKVSPNPVSNLAIVSYQAPTRNLVTVGVYDMNGVLVNTVYSQQLSAGPQKAAFNVRDMANGVYFVRVSSDDFISQQSIIVAH